MNKQELIQSLELCQSLNVTIPVDKVIEMINNLEETPVQSGVGITQEKLMEFAKNISDVIKDVVEERIEDHIDDYDVDLNGREIEVSNISVDVERIWRNYVVNDLKEHVEDFYIECLGEEVDS